MRAAREWKIGDNTPADYALVWQPPVEMLAGRRLSRLLRWARGGCNSGVN